MESGTRVGRMPACDHCKERKTKCDRGSPCSSCVAAGLNCHLSRRATEKRQRVLISARYDEAMENVDRSLQEVSSSLQKLLQLNEKRPGSPPAESSSSPPPTTTTTLVGNRLSCVPRLYEGYRGDSSFKAHVQRVTDALRDAAENLDVSMADRSYSTAMDAAQLIREAARGEEPTATDAAGSGRPSSPAPCPPQSSHSLYPDLQNRPLPAPEHVLKLVRLTQTEKQRFFIDLPIFNEAEFGELCQKVFFALNDYSIWAWISVNTGLYHLFFSLKPQDFSRVGVSQSDVQNYTRMSEDNIDVALQVLRLCQEPSMEACQALSLATTFCVKSGRSSVAWSLVSAAARMCIDLGWHRLPKPVGPLSDKEHSRRGLFWHIYIMDTGMAFTLGRSPSIHQYDVATERPRAEDFKVAPGYLYYGFFEFAMISGEMHTDLFSAAALQEPQHVRVGKAKSFANKLTQANNNLKQLLLNDPPVHESLHGVSCLTEIVLNCLMTIAYRIIPSDDPNSSPLQCSLDCIQAARQALTSIVYASEAMGGQQRPGWVMFLNMLFAIVPFACFVVLAGNTVASSSTEDLALLDATIFAIEPVSTNSASGKKFFEVCKSFFEIASLSVARRTGGQQQHAPLPPLPPPTTTTTTAMAAAMATTRDTMPPSFASHHPSPYPSGADGSLPPPLDASQTLSYAPNDIIMTPQDWDSVMGGLELGSGAGAMASFVEPYIPFYGRLP